MSTRSSARNLFPPLDNPEITIRRRSRADPTLLNDSEMSAEGNGDLPVPDLRTMEELCQPSLNGRATVAQTHNVYAVGAYQGNSYQPQGNRNLLGYRSDNYLVPPGFNQNQNRNNQNQNFQNQNRNQGNHHPEGNNQGRNQFFQGASHGQNPPPAYQAPAYQTPVYQALIHQPQIPQPQVVTTNEFTNFMKANDVILKNMQTNMTSLTNSNLELKNMFGQFMKMNTALYLGSGTLPGNTVTNPKEELKGITTCSGTAYQGPTIPTSSSFLPPVVERKTETTKDTMHPTNNESTKDVQPLVVQTESLTLNSKHVISPIIEPVAALVNLNFNISFTDALILMPKFGPSIKTLLINKDKLSELARTSLNEHFLAVLLKKLPKKLGDPELTPTLMILELSDRSISRPIDVTEDVYVKVGKFYFLADFVVVDFDADLGVPIILGRSFLKIGRALIDVFEGELTLRVGKEEYSQEVLGFFDVIASSNPTPYYDPIVSTTSSNLTPFGESDFLLEKVDAFLALEDDATSPEVDQSYINTEGHILLLEAFLNDDPLLPPPTQGNYLPQVELKDLPPHLEYAFLEGDDKFPVIIAKDLSVEEKTALITVLKSHKRAIAWKLSNIKGIDPKFCTHKILMEEDFEPTVQHQIKVNPKIYDVIKNERCMMAIFHDMIEQTMKVFMDDFSVFRNSFQTCLSNLEKMLKRCEDTNLCLNWEKSHFMVKAGIVLSYKISKNGIKVDKAKFDVIAKLPHPTTVKGIRSFLGHASFYRRFIKDFSKIAWPMNRLLKKDTPFFFSKECVEFFQTLKRKLTEAPILIAPDRDFPFELMCDASDFAIDHSALKYLFAKKDSKARLLHWVLLLQEFTFKVVDTKGAENIAANHLSRLENPHQNVLDPKEINESFPLETLNMVSFCDQASKGVYTARKPLTFSRLATMDPPRDIMAQITLPKRCLILDSILLTFSRFGTPRAIIDDREMHFCNDQFAKVMLKTVGENRASCSNKLDDTLWAFRRAYKTPIGCTPYKLIYGKACHLPIELEHKVYWPLKHANFNLQTAGDHKKVQLNELNELRDQAYENSLIYNEKTKRLHDLKIKDRVFNIGDRVLLFNSRLKIFSGKLKSRWSGPFTTSNVFPYSTVKLSQSDRTNFKVNGHRLKHYFGKDIPKMVVPDLQTFPKDQ
uniref:Reverse transcriptase domain-containing protein n=1 Tax=Tanacetum cinerariifolium TaxID=118510 RepID=A0A699H5B9_TANCI|nr:reverse transcriptase domain-containing protein [Tanacetum cinerariifolium]